MKHDKKNPYIVVNSLVYFLLAYYLVVFSSNLFIIGLAKTASFSAEISYNGFKLTGEKWSNDNIILVYFFGNMFTLFMAIFFQRLYYVERKYRKKINLFYLWVYIISLNWFMGEIIIGALFPTGMTSALIALRVPPFFRFLLVIAGIFSLIYFGNHSQRHVRVLANLYFPKLASEDTGSFFRNQILIPTLIGTVIIILLKLPNLNQYNYVDLYIILTIYLFIIGLFIRFRKSKSITFKPHKLNNKTLTDNTCSVSYPPLIILILVLIVIRIGLMNSVAL